MRSEKISAICNRFLEEDTITLGIIPGEIEDQDHKIFQAILEGNFENIKITYIKGKIEQLIWKKSPNQTWGNFSDSIQKFIGKDSLFLADDFGTLLPCQAKSLDIMEKFLEGLYKIFPMTSKNRLPWKEIRAHAYLFIENMNEDISEEAFKIFLYSLDAFFFSPDKISTENGREIIGLINKINNE